MSQAASSDVAVGSTGTVCGDEEKCGDYPRQKLCPCGKTKFNPGTEVVPKSMETCGKPLECGDHFCKQKCHPGHCGACQEIVRKRCRCGYVEQEVPCSTNLFCEAKIWFHRMGCGNHHCQRRCCDGNCGPCNKKCGKGLGCRHMCQSTCHQGPCPPCRVTVPITCNCGSRTLYFLCSEAKFSQPPRCSFFCWQPPDSLYAKRDPRHSHFGYVPPGRQTCGSFGHTKAVQPQFSEAIVKKVKVTLPSAGPLEAKRFKPATRVAAITMPCPSLDQRENSKTTVSWLQDLCMERGITPVYELLGREGPIHSTVHVFRVTADGCCGVGRGSSKKKAMQNAASVLLGSVPFLQQAEEVYRNQCEANMKIAKYSREDVKQSDGLHANVVETGPGMALLKRHSDTDAKTPSDSDDDEVEQGADENKLLDHAKGHIL